MPRLRQAAKTLPATRDDRATYKLTSNNEQTNTNYDTTETQTFIRTQPDLKEL